MASAPHSQVNHGTKRCVSRKIHANTIEGFWALAKRQHYGQHHHYSKKILINISSKLFLSITIETKAAKIFLIEYYRRVGIICINL
ncbi:MAG: transposase [Endomicrobium sp.]|nr:transposase [Endomicrobium sp.]